mmetsp:Transcript_18798/g.55126  ORF Transcript_18798/g.55126 Transcript_18798/m.55126 type:complete len:225 (+) Transcript_18798:283-957(+)
MLLYVGKLKLSFVVDSLLTPEVLGRQSGTDVRRVLVFVDSKKVANCLVHRLDGVAFRRRWGEDVSRPRQTIAAAASSSAHAAAASAAGAPATSRTVFPTPYHGDVARMHRRVYEGLMGRWVDEAHTHILVATSALEAGVNICGADVVIILDALRCSHRSLLQRIGRVGRQARRPGIVLMGVDLEADELLRHPLSRCSKVLGNTSRPRWCRGQLFLDIYIYDFDG